MRHLLLAALTASLVVAGCIQNGSTVETGRQQLAVWGSQSDVQSFVQLQGSRRPTLTVSSIRHVGRERDRAIIELPAGFTGQDLVHTTREALAAGLSYRFMQRRLVATSPS